MLPPFVGSHRVGDVEAIDSTIALRLSEVNNILLRRWRNTQLKRARRRIHVGALLSINRLAPIYYRKRISCLSTVGRMDGSKWLIRQAAERIQTQSRFADLNRRETARFGAIRRDLARCEVKNPNQTQ